MADTLSGALTTTPMWSFTMVSNGQPGPLHDILEDQLLTGSAYALTFAQNPDDLFETVSVEDYGRDLVTNSTSNFAAIKLAIAGFKKLPSDAPKAYIYIGNMCSGLIVPEVVTLGPGKNASL